MKIDEDIANTEWLLKLFKNIHPNCISLFGMVCNILIIMFLYLKEPNNANIFLVIRYFCDILDGAVARKYNKTSKLGGYLDTIDDIMLITLYSGFIIWKKTENIKYTGIGSIVILLVLICYFKSEDSLSDHKNLKKDSNNIFKKLVKFIVDNSILVYIIMYYVNIKYLV